MAGVAFAIPLFYAVVAPHHFSVVSCELMGASCMRNAYSGCVFLSTIPFHKMHVVVCVCAAIEKCIISKPRPSIEKYFSSSQSSFDLEIVCLQGNSLTLGHLVCLMVSDRVVCFLFFCFVFTWIVCLN